MKIQKTANGTMIIIFQKNEVDQICQSNQINLNLVDPTELSNPKDDPYKCLRSNTISFIKELHHEYGNNEFLIKQEFISNLRKKHFILDLESSLRTISLRNFCELNYTTTNKLRKLSSVKFKL